MIQIGQLASSLTDGEKGKIYQGKLWSESFRIWLYHIWQGVKRKISGSSELGANQFRLISESWFMEDDFLDVSMDIIPLVGQKIEVQEIGGIFLIVRKTDQKKAFEFLKKQEGLEHSSDSISREYLKERYPYLLSPSDKAYQTCQLLEVIDVFSMYN